METRHRKLLALLPLLLLSTSEYAGAWDPIGDITHPDRIVRNVGREVDNAGRAVDKARLEAQAQAGAPIFEQAINASRATAINGGVQPIPPDVRQDLTGYIDEDVLNRARYKVGDNGIVNIANLSIRYGDAAAVTLVDVIVFANPLGIRDRALWAHELTHVRQYRDWGTRDFAIRYLRSWNGVENEAYDVQNQYAAWQSQHLAQQSGQGLSPPPMSQGPMLAQNQLPIPVPAPLPVPVARQPYSNACFTPQGPCLLPQPVPLGIPCGCQTPVGVFGGVTR
ncbi:DUF4157 domain-containing protein [Caballeronia sp. ATUFL_M2_KS44]|uniref:eCIS core domain-containing protein n=1 Tax=Caballeronia sp. ATUFL_M2_KS44 TaxID=2921767 RepID=UPI002028137A|nr:DUF4157 domain-containing protein [Caballeronia sp. ATUFL_M2_KS44]